MNLAIKKVTEDLENFKFNTAISKIMEYVNFLINYKNSYDYRNISFKNAMIALIYLLHPFCPHITEEIKECFNIREILDFLKWPIFDEKKIVSINIEIPIQINGKLRGVVEVINQATEEIVLNAVKSDEKFINYVKDKNIIKTIYIKNRLLNLIIK